MAPAHPEEPCNILPLEPFFKGAGAILVKPSKTAPAPPEEPCKTLPKCSNLTAYFLVKNGRDKNKYCVQRISAQWWGSP
jgi:hypothetical protein